MSWNLGPYLEVVLRSDSIMKGANGLLGCQTSLKEIVHLGDWTVKISAVPGPSFHSLFASWLPWCEQHPAWLTCHSCLTSGPNQWGMHPANWKLLQNRAKINEQNSSFESFSHRKEKYVYTYIRRLTGTWGDGSHRKTLEQESPGLISSTHLNQHLAW